MRQEWWGRERALRRDLASIQRLQQTAPGSEELRLQALRAKALLEETLLRRSEFSYHASLSYWARKGDRMSREFFRTHGQRAAGDQIRSLRTAEGHITTDQEEVMGLATDFYRTLFQQEQLAPRTRRSREEVWRHTPALVQPCMQAALMAPFTTSEMQEALMAIDGQKYPGEDGLSRAFFTIFWEH